MRGCENPDAIRRRVGPATLVLLATMICLVTNANAAGSAGISVQYASSKLVGQTYRMDAKIQFKFDDEIVAALKSGVELSIDVLTEIKRERKWLWDPTVTEGLFRFTLKHYPLTDEYVVDDITNGEHHEFSSYDAALNFLGSIRNQPLVDRSEIDKDATYIGYIKARLNIETLPTPLQPSAYISEKWRLESSWYEWVVK